MAKELTVKMSLTERELWEMETLFSSRYADGGWGNPVAECLGLKIKKAQRQLDTLKRNT